jgi:hypothetical protein
MGLPTNNYGLQQPTVGGEVGTWGTNLNNNTIAPLDSILGNALGVTITSADVNITNTQFQNAVFKSSGALTGAHTLFLPVGSSGAVSGSTQFAVGGRFVVENNTTGSFLLTVNSTLPGAVGAIVPQGGRSELYSDGTNVKTVSFGDLSGCFATTVSSTPQGQLAGQAGSSAVGMNTQIAYDAVNNTLYACTTTGTSATASWSQPSQPAASVPRGFDTAVNLQLTATVLNNVLTIAAQAANTSTDPTALNPIIYPFPDSTLANGDPVYVNQTGPLSISTSSALGATLGSANNTPFRFWILGFNNGGTPALALVNCVNPLSSVVQVFGLDEAGQASATAMSSLARSIGTIYCSSGTTITNKTFRLLGYLTYETGLGTAGTYTTTPDVVRLFGPGIKKPGDVIQTVTATSTLVAASSATTRVNTNTSVSITPKSKANTVFLSANGPSQTNGGGSVAIVQLGRGGGPTFVGNICGNGGVGGFAQSMAIAAADYPQQTSSAVTYSVYIHNGGTPNTNGAVWNPAGVATINPSAFIQAQEIMG